MSCFSVAYPYPVKLLLAVVPYEIGICALVLEKIDARSFEAQFFRLTFLALPIPFSTRRFISAWFGKLDAECLYHSFAFDSFQ